MSTEGASVRNKAYAIAAGLQGVLRTGLHTGAAAHAFALFVEQLLPWRPTLRVVTPDTPQRTSLDEYRGAYPWSVIDGIPLDVENERHMNSDKSPRARNSKMK